MSSGIAEAIKQLVQDKGISEDLVIKTIEDFLLAAYKRTFGTVDNAVVQFSEDGNEVELYAQKVIVEDVYDPVAEIALEDALVLNEEGEIGDELLIPIDPLEFDRVAVQSAKQKAKQTLREIQKDTLFSEYNEKLGEMIIGYYQREKNGNIYVDLGKTEGILPKRFQSPREVYRPNDRIKALIYEINKTPSGLQIVLSRTHTDFVKRVFELEVPEIYDKTVEIFKIVREPGYRTKIAVYSNRDDVDPVGACVGMKGVRIQAIVRELEGEKIDILKYDVNPRVFIKNALSPAEVNDIIVLDEAKRQALAIVGDSQLSLAIGKQGLNVRLANRLADWNIDVKTEEQFEEMDIAVDTRRAVSELFGEVDDSEEITSISELPGITDSIISVLKEHNIELIEDLIALSDDELTNFSDLSDEDVDLIRSIIADNVDIIEEEEDYIEEEYESSENDYSEEEFSSDPAEENDDEETSDESEDSEEDEGYECPECGAPITLDMTACPSCGVGISFEIEEADEDEDEE
ncbi:MAG: transcription termination factor NusA [Spirochaetales bacterium]|uniref:Transcription termination/antitermination protein NusA n=1 Tax=Candidatus Thalassospirochaeta sargassi TaxID=3119039 RepID=A0AAJ1IAV4_9SPIO|nr:transcription termination factor NusA [Spirochaetales bacterium]